MTQPKTFRVDRQIRNSLLYALPINVFGMCSIDTVALNPMLLASNVLWQKIMRTDKDWFKS